MPNAGYSGTPLIKKLGIKDDMKVLLMNAPGNYFELIEKNISHQFINKNEVPDFVHLFVKSKKEFEKQMNKLFTLCKKNHSIIIWVSWYKKSAGIATDITENEIRNYGLQNNLVDIKVCAVSEHWSGLKFVVPLIKR